MKNKFYNKGQSLIGILIVLFVVGLATGGLYYYLSKQISEVSEITQKPAKEEIVKPEEETTPSPEEELPEEEIAPEKEVTPEEKAEKKPAEIPKETKPEAPKIICQNECSQGGLKKCSNNGYQICGNYDADNCLEWSLTINCSSNTICQSGICIQQKCTDGTPFSQCSINKPKYCDNGNLVNRCSLCGCPLGQQCQTDENCAVPSAEPYQIPVLNLSYIPIKNSQVDISFTGDWQNPDVNALRANINNLTQQLISALNQGSIYHGYKDTSAVPSLNYTIFKDEEFLEPVPTLSLSNSPADHKKILTELNICDYVENKGIKEVWIWMYHTNKVYPVESYLTGPLYSFGNGFMDLPKCAKSYTVFDFNYGRAVAMALENHTHQIERVFNYIDGRDAAPHEKWKDLLFWGKFVGSDFSHKIIAPGCGWTHYPPNGESDYDWNNQKEVLSDCEDWKPDGTGQKKMISCHTWGGSNCKSDEGYSFKIWWMQNIPGKNNNLIYNGKKLKNWWNFIGDFDQAMQIGKNLTY